MNVSDLFKDPHEGEKSLSIYVIYTLVQSQRYKVTCTVNNLNVSERPPDEKEAMFV